MNEDILRALRAVYKNSLNETIYYSLTNYIDALVEDQFSERVRFDPSMITGSPPYFSVKSLAFDSPVIFAGRLICEEEENRPYIRFRNTNPILSMIPENFKFPFYYKKRAEPWSCVVISENTINYFPLLFENEIQSNA